MRERAAPIPNCASCRKPVSAKTARVLSRTQRQTAAADRRGSPEPGVLVSVIQLEKRFDDRQAWHPHRLASEGF
jgi:hypothetical protein